jgi:hypothetical protein
MAKLRLPALEAEAPLFSEGAAGVDWLEDPFDADWTVVEFVVLCPLAGCAEISGVGCWGRITGIFGNGAFCAV